MQIGHEDPPAKSVKCNTLHNLYQKHDAPILNSNKCRIDLLLWEMMFML